MTKRRNVIVHIATSGGIQTATKVCDRARYARVECHTQPSQRAIAVGLVAMAFAGCRDSSGPSPILERRQGVLSLGNTPSTTVPGDGTVGVPIPLAIVTVGGGCMRQGDTDVRVGGLAADVTPYDSVYVYLPPQMACTSDLRYYTHQTSVVFDAIGVATVRIHGRAGPGSVPMTVERTIRIQ
jgi:hypothetical protein